MFDGVEAIDRMHLADALIGMCRDRCPALAPREGVLREGPVALAASLLCPWGARGRLTLTETRLLFRENAPFSRLFGLDDGGREFLLDLIVLASAPAASPVDNEPGFCLRMACGEVVQFHTAQTLAWIRAIEHAAGRRLWFGAGERRLPPSRPVQFR